jgi:hypothetical protein
MDSSVSKKHKHNPPHANRPNQTHHHGGAERHVSGDIRVRGEVETKVSADAAAKHDTERNEDVDRDSKQLTLARWTLFALVVYAAFAGWQAWLTRRLAVGGDDALKLSKEQFVKDQRPYVWPAEIDPHPLKLGEQVKANVYFVNYGKTPAINEKSAGKILLFVGEGTLKQADTFFDTFDESKVIGGSELILPPGIPQDSKKSPSFITTYSDATPKDQPAIDEINKTDGSFAIVGVVTYFDSAGTHYRSNYCMMHLANGALAWCARHNEIH